MRSLSLPGSDGVGDVGAAHALESALAAGLLGDAAEVVAAQLGTALADAVGDFDQCGVHLWLSWAVVARNRPFGI